MKTIFSNINDLHNFVFIGGAGSGKSELALNIALKLKEKGDKEVHLLDLDMTKPLFRSRDVTQELEKKGIRVHFQQQFMDAPTTVGGVESLMRNPQVYTILDVGGDDLGARSIGRLMGLVNQKETGVYYMLNPYRPWSKSIEGIDQTLGAILGVSHIKLDKIQFIGNPNKGEATTLEDVLTGAEVLEKTLLPHATIAFFAVAENLAKEVKEKLTIPIIPMRLHLNHLGV